MKEMKTNQARIQKTITIIHVILIVLLGIVSQARPLYADNTQPPTNVLYLPVISSWRPVTIDRVENADFAIDSYRLWHITENGGAGSDGKMAAPINCGTTHKVQIHVFDSQGDISPQSRLNGVIIHVRHSDGRTQREELKPTGLARYGTGTVEFDLQSWAEVKVMTNVNGRLVTSDVARISTEPLAISQAMLIKSGYCQDEADCRRFVSANTCNGLFSWNVVFKRQEKR